MDFFQKLSDPVYFSKFGNRFMVVFSILSILFWCFMIYMSVSNGKPTLSFFWGTMIMMSIGNLVRSSKRLKNLS